MPIIYLSLGSNMGDRLEMLRHALDCINDLPTTKIEEVAPLYESAPWGVTDQPKFLNSVVRLRSGLTPRDLLVALKRIEWDTGRRASERWGPRPLDIDILLYDDLEVNSRELTIPHPSMWKRRFVLEPLSQIYEDDQWEIELSPDGLLGEVADQELEMIQEEWWQPSAIESQR